MKLLLTLAVSVGFLCNARLHMDLTAAKQKAIFIRNWPLYRISFLSLWNLTIKSGHGDQLNQNSNLQYFMQYPWCICKVISSYNIQQKIYSSKAYSWVLCKILSHLLSGICSHSFTPLSRFRFLPFLCENLSLEHKNYTTGLCVLLYDLQSVYVCALVN